MSISNEEWDAGRTSHTLEGQILVFLKKNQKPFSFWGIMEGLGYNTNIKDLGALFHSMVDVLDVQNALNKLTREGAVVFRIVQKPNGPETYYKAV